MNVEGRLQVVRASSDGPERPAALRPKDARPAVALARLLLAPFAASAAALAGLVYVLLLPVCGIASIAEGMARACWRWVRRAVARRERP